MVTIIYLQGIRFPRHVRLRTAALCLNDGHGREADGRVFPRPDWQLSRMSCRKADQGGRAEGGRSRPL